MGLNLDQISAEGKYYKNDTEFNGNIKDETIWSVTGPKKEEKVYTYDEAINLTGNGWYNISLLITLALAMQAMSVDMFGFTYVVAAAACDLQLTRSQTSFLLSVPLVGAIISAYPWGYYSDTRGRKKSLIVGFWGSFVVSSLSSLSPNFTVLAILKFFSSCLCSGTQSIAYTLLGESCCGRTKGSYLLIMTSSLMCAFAVFTAHAYIVLGIDFTYDLGFITLKPWRLLILTLAMSLGSSAVFLQFFYESPKFLVNIGRTTEAVEVLKNIKRRNRDCGPYPVKKIILLEDTSLRCSGGSFLRSLWDQTVPLFKPPLLKWLLLLFYIIAVLFSVNNGFYVWMPIIFNSYFEETSIDNVNATGSFCDLINSSHSDTKSGNCISVVKLEMLIVAIVQGFIFIVINFGIAGLIRRKKIMHILIFTFACLCCFAMLIVTEKIATIALFFGIQMNCFSMGIVFTYIIDLFPTRYRCMTSCLAMMVARVSALLGVRLIGAFAFTHCTTSLYVWGTFMFSGVLISLLLPPDTKKNDLNKTVRLLCL